MTRDYHDEIVFWRSWFETKGGEFAADFAHRTQYDILVPRYLDFAAWGASVLDVASGPISSLGTGGGRIALTCVDVLATHYNYIRDVAVHPDRVPFSLDVEDLVRHFYGDQFDVAHCRNGIDHCEDPVVALRQMVAVTRAGGYLVLHHHLWEGRAREYDGLHAWNFTPYLTIEGRNGTTIDLRDFGAVVANEVDVAANMVTTVLLVQK